LETSPLQSTTQMVTVLFAAVVLVAVVFSTIFSLLIASKVVFYLYNFNSSERVFLIRSLNLITPSFLEGSFELTMYPVLCIIATLDP